MNTNIQTTIYNFIKTIECQRYICKQSIKDFVSAHLSEKYSNKNLNNIWSSCNHHFDNGIYLYLHRYQKLKKKQFSKNIDLSSINIIKHNTNNLYNLYKNINNKNDFITIYTQNALNNNLDNLINNKS